MKNSTSSDALSKTMKLAREQIAEHGWLKIDHMLDERADAQDTE